MSEINIAPALPGHKAPKPVRTVEQELIRRNRPVLLGALKELGLNQVNVDYSGSGDSGGIEQTRILPVGSDESIETTGAFNEHRVTIWWTDAFWSQPSRGAKFARKTMALAEAIHEIAEELLDQHFGGFENNDGGSGSVVFDAGEKQIRIDHDWNITTTEFEQVIL